MRLSVAYPGFLEARGSEWPHLLASIYRNCASYVCFKAPGSCCLILFARPMPSKVILQLTSD